MPSVPALMPTPSFGSGFDRGRGRNCATPSSGDAAACAAFASRDDDCVCANAAPDPETTSTSAHDNARKRSIAEPPEIGECSAFIGSFTRGLQATEADY